MMRPTIAAVVLLILLSLWIGTVPTSEGFVSMQYARNVAHGYGVVFNPGDAPTEGYTSLLWVLVNALVFLAGLDASTLSPFLAMLFGAACLVFTMLLLQRRAQRWSAWVIPLILLATSAPFLAAAHTRTDVTLFSLLILAGAWSLDRLPERPSVRAVILPSFLLVMAALCRFEGIVVAVVGLIALLRRRDGGRAGALIVAVTIIAYHAWRTLTFGAFVPSTTVLDLGLNAAIFGGPDAHSVPRFAAYYLVVALISSIAFVSARRPADRHVLAVLAILGAYYLFLDDHVPGLGNHAVLLPLALLAWPHLIRPDKLDAQMSNGARRTRIAIATGALLLSLGVVSDMRLTVDRFQESQERALGPVAAWLEEWRPGLAIATDDPGAVSFLTSGPTLDLRHHSAIGGKENRARELQRQTPDLIILAANQMFRPELIADTSDIIPFIQSRYRLLGAIRTAWSFDRCILIYARNDIPRLTEEQRESFPEGVGSVVRVNY